MAYKKVAMKDLLVREGNKMVLEKAHIMVLLEKEQMVQLLAMVKVLVVAAGMVVVLENLDGHLRVVVQAMLGMSPMVKL